SLSATCKTTAKSESSSEDDMDWWDSAIGTSIRADQPGAFGRVRCTLAFASWQFELWIFLPTGSLQTGSLERNRSIYIVRSQIPICLCYRHLLVLVSKGPSCVAVSGAVVSTTTVGRPHQAPWEI